MGKQFDDFFPGTYMNAAYVKGKLLGKNLVITEIKEETVGKANPEQKLVMYFAEDERGLVLNKTNANILKESFGGDTENCHGKIIQLIITSTQMGPGIGIVVQQIGESSPAPSGGV